MSSVWMIRADGGALIDTFLMKGVVSIKWDVGDLTSLSKKDEIADRLKVVYPEASPLTLSIWTGVVYRFRSEIEIHDHVVTYDPSTRTYHLGEISTDYYFDAVDDPVWPHTRKVNWLHQVSRDALSLSTKNSLGATLTLFKLGESASAELLAVAAGQQQPQLEEQLEGVSETDLLEETLNRSREFVKDRMAKLTWQQMQELVAGLLRAMGYKTRVSPQGSDRGRDIVASPDGFGLEQPRIVVEVKHRKHSSTAPDLRSFLGGRHKDDKGLYVSTGGFTQEARYEADRSAIPLALMDLDDLVSAVFDHYEEMDVDTRSLLPMVRLYWPT